MARFSSLKNWASGIAAMMKDYDIQRLKEALMKYESKVFKNSVASRMTILAAGLALAEYVKVQIDEQWSDKASDSALLSRANAECLTNRKVQEEKMKIEDKMLVLAMSLSELNHIAFIDQREAKTHLIGGLKDLLDDMAAKEEDSPNVKELKNKTSLKLESLKEIIEEKLC